AVALELRRPYAGDGGQLTEVTGLPRGDLRQRRVVEDDVSRLLVRRRPLEPPPLQRRVERIVRFGLAPLHEMCLDTQLGEEADRPSAPRQCEVPLGARDADVKQTPLLRDLGIRLRELDRQLTLLDAREKHRLELETLRPV